MIKERLGVNVHKYLKTLLNQRFKHYQSKYHYKSVYSYLNNLPFFCPENPLRSTCIYLSILNLNIVIHVKISAGKNPIFKLDGFKSIE